ncbi:MAG: YbaB/EbfC family nucleoid-associated protein [Candidatus Sericytochromatia bacterium]
MKNKFPGGFGGGGMDLGKIMKEAQKMQESLLQVQDDLGNHEVEGTSGGGAVKVKANGKHFIKSVKISKDAVDEDDLETLEDLIVAAVNDAINKANNLAQSKMNNITGGMNIPGLDKLF